MRTGFCQPAGRSSNPSRARNTLTSVVRPARSRARPSSAVPASINGYSCIAEPHPAAFVSTASTSPPNAARLRRAKPRAPARSPVCHDNPPQHPWPRGTHTSTPFRARTSIVATLMSGSSTCCAHPASNATRARRALRAGVRSGNATADGKRPGTSSSIGRSAEGISARNAFPMPARRAAHRNRPGYGNVQRINARRTPSQPDVATPAPTVARYGLIKSRYGTPLGHAGSQARQPRQRSTCGRAASAVNRPSITSFIKTIRPRGESISCPSSRYVGHAARQNPQCTHASTARAIAGPIAPAFPTSISCNMRYPPPFTPFRPCPWSPSGPSRPSRPFPPRTSPRDRAPRAPHPPPPSRAAHPATGGLPL